MDLGPSKGLILKQLEGVSLLVAERTSPHNFGLRGGLRSKDCPLRRGDLPDHLPQICGGRGGLIVLRFGPSNAVRRQIGTRIDVLGPTDMTDPFYYPIFAIDAPEELESMLSSAGLGTLITMGGEGFVVTHIPFIFDPSQRLLRGHVSLRNPQSKTAAGDALVIFGGAEAYVSPAFYPSKAVHGRVAPTWNYEFLHVRGPIRWIADREWLLRNLEELTDRHERKRSDPWRVEDAPADFTEKLLSQILGIEVAVQEIEGRRKYSQNESRENREGVVNGLKAGPGLAEQRLADAMATHLAPGAGREPRA